MEQNDTKPTSDYIFGTRAVIEAIKFQKEIDRILVKRGLTGETSKELMELIHQNNINYQLVPGEKLDRITRKNHQGVIALISPVSFFELEETVVQLFEEGKVPFLLILDEVTDVRNFGAIVRTAECAGVHAIIIPEKGSARIGSDAVKTSAGALLKVPVCRVSSLKKAIRYLQNSGITTFGVSEKANQNYYQHQFVNPVCLVMGAEDTGISNDVLRICDNLIKIPLMGSIESLNVSVAASVLMYEVVRQRINH